MKQTQVDGRPGGVPGGAVAGGGMGTKVGSGGLGFQIAVIVPSHPHISRKRTVEPAL